MKVQGVMKPYRVKVYIKGHDKILDNSMIDRVILLVTIPSNHVDVEYASLVAQHIAGAKTVRCHDAHCPALLTDPFPSSSIVRREPSRSLILCRHDLLTIIPTILGSHGILPVQLAQDPCRSGGLHMCYQLFVLGPFGQCICKLYPQGVAPLLRYPFRQPDRTELDQQNMANEQIACSGDW